MVLQRELLRAKEAVTLRVRPWVLWWLLVALLGAVAYVVFTALFNPPQSIRVVLAIVGIFICLGGGFVTWAAQGIKKV